MSEENITPKPAGGVSRLPARSDRGAERIQAIHGPVDPSRRIEVTVILRRREPLTETPAEPLSSDELAARHGASSADLRLATERLTRLGAQILEADSASRRLRLAGTVENLNRIFDTRYSWPRPAPATPRRNWPGSTTSRQA